MTGSAGRPSTDRDARRRRADAYVLGRLRSAEREQAEADLETDQVFRDEVLAAAHRLGQVPDAYGDGSTPEGWDAIATHLTTLPHMQPRSAFEDPRAPRAETRMVEEPEIAGSLPSRVVNVVQETFRTLRALLRPPR